MENVLQILDIMKVTNDIEADEVLEQIRDLRAEAQRLEMIANARIENITKNLQFKLEAIGTREKMLMDQLRAYALNLKFKETKTQKKYKLVTGELVVKKPTIKIEVADREKLIQYAENSAQEYVKVKKDVDWSGLKKVLDIDGSSVINKETGEVLGDLEGITVKEVGEIFDIKL